MGEAEGKLRPAGEHECIVRGMEKKGKKKAY